MSSEAKFNRFTISLRDFEKSLAFFAEANNHQYGSLAHEALLFSGIVCFFRPFTNNELDANSKAARKLELSDFEPLSANEMEIYEKCELLRNKALAHAEISNYPTSFNPKTGVISGSMFSLVGRIPDMNALQKLNEKFIEQCHNKLANYVRANRAP